MQIMNTNITYDDGKTAIYYAKLKHNNIKFYIGEDGNSYFRNFAKLIVTSIPSLCPWADAYMRGVKIILDDSENFAAYQSKKQIVLPIKLFAYLWFSAYLHYAQYTRTKWGNNDIKEQCNRDIIFTRSMIECQEAREAIMQNQAYNWPSGITPPDPNYNLSNDPTDENMASEIALHSITCIFLHELKHYIDFKNGLRHPARRHEELAADFFAIKNFLRVPRRRQLNSAKLKRAIEKRMMALLEMGCLFSDVELAMDEEDGIHPDGFSRLNNVIKLNSNILNLSDDTEYNPVGEITDIRPLIQYASFVLGGDAQLALSEDADLMPQFWAILSQVHESPFHYYKELLFFLCNHIQEIHDRNLYKNVYGIKFPPRLSFRNALINYF